MRRSRRSLVVLAAVALGAYLYERNRTGSIYHPHAPFRAAADAHALPKRRPDRFAWPLYGYTKNHTRFFPAPEQRAPAVPPALGAQRARDCSSSRP